MPSPARVLIVDDDPVCRLFCVHALTTAGYQTFTAIDGGSAIRTALREQPQVVLTDMHLPDMSGADVMLKMLKLWPDAKANPRFVFMSGDDSVQAHPTKWVAGFDSMLIKPFPVEALLACVKKSENQAADAAKHPAQRFAPGDAVSTPGPQQASGLPLQTVFRIELNQQLFELDHLITSLEWKRAAEILHRLSGGAALAGFSVFARRGRLLLQHVSQPQDIANLAETYLDFLHQATDLLEEQPLDPGSGFRHYE